MIVVKFQKMNIKTGYLKMINKINVGVTTAPTFSLSYILSSSISLANL